MDYSVTFDELLVFSGSYHGHIIKLTNVKSSPNKRRYHNALVHDGMKENHLQVTIWIRIT